MPVCIPHDDEPAANAAAVGELQSLFQSKIQNMSESVLRQL